MTESPTSNGSRHPFVARLVLIGAMVSLGSIPVLGSFKSQDLDTIIRIGLPLAIAWFVVSLVVFAVSLVMTFVERTWQSWVGLVVGGSVVALVLSAGLSGS